MKTKVRKETGPRHISVYIELDSRIVVTIRQYDGNLKWFTHMTDFNCVTTLEAYDYNGNMYEGVKRFLDEPGPYTIVDGKKRFLTPKQVSGIIAKVESYCELA